MKLDKEKEVVVHLYGDLGWHQQLRYFSELGTLETLKKQDLNLIPFTILRRFPVELE